MTERGTLEELWPDVYNRLLQIRDLLEKEYRDVIDLEFVIQEGDLYLTSSRKALRSPRANLRFALQFFAERKIALSEMLARIELGDIEAILMPDVHNKAELQLLGKGLPAFCGAGLGLIATTSSKAESLVQSGEDVVLVKSELHSDDAHVVPKCRGVITSRGGMTSHAGLLCRSLKKPCVVGVGALGFDYEKPALVVSGYGRLEEGDAITLDGFIGSVYAGKGDIRVPSWNSHFELRLLQQLVEVSILTSAWSSDTIGKIWRIRDFFFHGIPLSRPRTKKRAATSRNHLSLLLLKLTLSIAYGQD